MQSMTHSSANILKGYNMQNYKVTVERSIHEYTVIAAESQQEAEELVLMYCDELEMREIEGYENVKVLHRYTIVTDEEPYTSEAEEEENDDEVDEYY